MGMNIVGHEKIISFLEKSIANDSPAHCYIFSGPNNIGKTAIAQRLAAQLLQKEPSVSLDFFQIKPVKNSISKEEADGAIGRLSLTAFGGGYKILIIESAHLMTISAANAFLKTLEEPPKKTVIILITSELGKILPTIISRAVVLRFNPVGKDELKKLLLSKNADEPKNYINLSFGRPGKILNFLENKNWQAEQKEGAMEFYNLFFGPSAERLKASAAIFKNKDSQKENIFKKIDFWLELIRDVLLMKYKLNDNVAHLGEKNILEKISENKAADYFSGLANRLIKMRSLIKNNINIQLMLENLII